MANPLVYDLRDYESALNKFRNAQRSYNKQIDEYNKTLVFDSQGRTLIKEKFDDRVYAVTDEGKLQKTGLPEGKSLEDFNYSSLPDTNRFLLVRQGNPLEQKEVREATPYHNAYSNPDYQTRTDSIYQDKPEAFQMVEPKRPNPTIAQAKRFKQGDPLAAERGIIGDIIQSKGIR